MDTLLGSAFAIAALWLLQRKDEPHLLRRLGSLLPLTGRWRRYLIAAALLVPTTFPSLQRHATQLGLWTVITTGAPFGCTGPVYDIPPGFSFRRSAYPMEHSAYYARTSDWIVGVIKLAP